ncbi:hypothetical protein [Pasteuria penetrans]|uniref:hypothetical protein n=1 Tax=Pasteuria penetrans TaxID=86005 RepID=UPI0011EF2A61|nr:hypothetical protein [Pasteuria penetrans]
MIERLPREGLFFEALGGKKGKPLIGRRTLYDGRKRLLAYEEKARCNGTQGSFQHFTTFQKSIVGMISTCRRMDSTLINSNIRKLTRNEVIDLVAKNVVCISAELQIPLPAEWGSFWKRDANKQTSIVSNHWAISLLSSPKEE